MVEITRSSGNYAFIASVNYKQNAEALQKISQAAGKSAVVTETSLSGQTADLQRFIDRVAPEAETAAAFETTRGINRSAEISESIQQALKSTQFRIATSDSANKTRAIGAGGSKTNDSVLTLLRGANSGNDSFSFAFLDTSFTSSSKTPQKIKVSASEQDLGDPFGRKNPIATSVSGTATVSITRAALSSQKIDVLLDKKDASVGSFVAAFYTADGTFQSDNDGFAITSTTGSADDTVIFDTRDATQEDGRLSAIDLDTGAGSDFVFIAGNNITKLNAGEGDDFIVVEGDSIIDGGEGNDLIFARTASGDAGDDIIFSNGFASGGEGDDVLTLFTLDSENDTSEKVAYGGSGNDQIIASVRGDIDGGDGDDILILRDGGTAGGGSGDDRISAYSQATIEAGDGNDDIFLLKNGSVDAGAGDDIIVAKLFSSVSGGTGNDTVTLEGGGIYTYRKGDGADKVEIGAVKFAEDEQSKVQPTKIVLDGYDYSDLTVEITAVGIKITPKDASVKTDDLRIQREVLGTIQVVFRNNGREQILNVSGLTERLGAIVST
jgi:Ca2+-binding RTX toxin-like protein